VGGCVRDYIYLEAGYTGITIKIRKPISKNTQGGVKAGVYIHMPKSKAHESKKKKKVIRKGQQENIYVERNEEEEDCYRRPVENYGEPIQEREINHHQKAQIRVVLS